MKITIGHLYPDLLNLYGDRGNIQCLMKRCLWRGIEAETIAYELDDRIDFSKLDIVLLGGGSDREQMLVCEKLKEIQKDFKAYVEDNGVVIAICGGYQLLGNYYKTDQGMIEGLKLVDMSTEQGKGRLIGNIVMQSDLFDMPIVGFENHGGRTTIGNNRSLGKVLSGYGNDGQSGEEGVVYKNVIGTYLHGPLLPKNPQLADLLISRALEKKYGKKIELEKLDDSEEQEANSYIFHRFVKNAGLEDSMSKSIFQKAKILYLEKMLRETGEHRVISMQKILENLEKQGIRAERKSIYDDVEVLRSFGMDIRYTRERPGGYYLAGESAGEEQPSEEPGLTAEAKEIHETKDIHETSVTGYRKLLEASAGTIKKEIKLLCTGAVQAEVRDFFGTDAEYKMKDSGDLTVTAELPENGKFYGWLTGMGGSVRILKPKKSVAAYRDYLKSLAKDYKGL